MPSSRTPSQVPRIVILALLSALAIAAAGLGINGLAKFNQVKSDAKKEAPPGVSVDIVTGNFVPLGILVAVACGKLFLASAAALFIKPLSTRFLRIQAVVFAFCAAFLLAVLIPFTDFYVNHSASLSVHAGNITIPPNIVQSVLGSQEATLQYKQHGPLRAAVIVAWLVWPFAVASAILMLQTERALAIAGRNYKGREETEERGSMEKPQV